MCTTKLKNGVAYCIYTTAKTRKIFFVVNNKLYDEVKYSNPHLEISSVTH